jgi:hypothetical protein
MMNSSFKEREEEGLHKDKQVTNGVKKAFQRLFPTSIQTEVREKFACFATRLENFSYISSLDERRTMDLVKWWTCHGTNGVYLQNLTTRILSQVESSSLAERNWSTYGFIHFVKHNMLGLHNIDYHVHTSHKQHSPKVWFETDHFQILSFSGSGLRVPTLTSGPRIDPREKFSWILEIWKVSTQSDEQNPKIVSKMEEFEFSAKFARNLKFIEN